MATVQPVTFGALLRRHRLESGLTQQELAERAGLSQRGLAALEGGERSRPHGETVRLLADALQLTGVERNAFDAAARGSAIRLPVPTSLPETAPIPLHPPTNLPAPPTPFIGRAQELRLVDQLLRRDEVRVLTLTGPGGAGKTRLAMEAARGVLKEFRDGVFFVSLGAVASPAEVLPTIARTLGMADETETSSLSALREQLRDRQLLLVLDTFEHLLPAASDIAELLATCPRLQMLVTSRVLLHLSGEQHFPVPPMALPHGGEATPEEIERWDATSLFVLRAQAIAPQFAVTRQNAPLIAAVCARLDGLPLALELAAARVAVLPLPALLDRLSNRFSLLSRGARDAPPRQQTMRAAVDWSYQLLNEGERRLLARLGVFAGGCTLEAAEAVCGLDADRDIFDDLSVLVDSSLVRTIEGVGGEPRFLMLDTIQEFAVEKLKESGEAELMARRHAEYFVHLAERVDPPRPPDRVNASTVLGNFRLIDQEHANIAAALSWLRDHDEGTLGLRLLGAVRVAWYQLLRLQDLRSWLESFEPYVDKAPPAVRAGALLIEGKLASEERFSPTFEEAIAVYRTVDDDYIRLRGLVAAASAMFYIPNPAPQVEALFEETRLLARMLRSSSAEAASLRALATIALKQKGDRARAEQLFQESLALDREAGHTSGVGDTLSVLAELAIEDGDLPTARAYLSEIIEHRQARGNEDAAMIRRLWIGVIELLEGNLAALDARLRETRSHPRFQTIGRQGTGIHVMMLCLAASSASAREEPERAARLFGAVAAILQGPGSGMVVFWFWEVFESFRSAAQAQIDEPIWRAAWEEGQAMTVEEAIAYALDETTLP